MAARLGRKWRWDRDIAVDWPRNKAQSFPLFPRFSFFLSRRKRGKSRRKIGERERDWLFSPMINSIWCARQKLSYRFDWLPRNETADEAGNRWKRRKCRHSIGVPRSFILLRFTIAKMERDRRSSNMARFTGRGGKRTSAEKKLAPDMHLCSREATPTRLILDRCIWNIVSR